MDKGNSVKAPGHPKSKTPRVSSRTEREDARRASEHCQSHAMAPCEVHTANLENPCGMSDFLRKHDLLELTREEVEKLAQADRHPAKKPDALSRAGPSEAPGRAAGKKLLK